jgi:predicted transcriptional regulator
VITKAKIEIDKSGYKQVYIAQKINIDPTLLSMYLMGHRPLPIEVAKEISKLIKIPVSNLIEEKVEQLKQ